MTEIKTWHEIRQDFHDWAALPLVPSNIRKYSSGYVIDENQSVKWNREAVEKHNAWYDEEAQSLVQESANIYSLILESVCTRIQADVGHNLSRETAMAIWDYAYDEAASGASARGFEEEDLNDFAALVVQDLIKLLKSVLDDVHSEEKKDA